MSMSGLPFSCAFQSDSKLLSSVSSLKGLLSAGKSKSHSAFKTLSSRSKLSEIFPDAKQPDTFTKVADNKPAAVPRKPDKPKQNRGKKMTLGAFLSQCGNSSEHMVATSQAGLRNTRYTPLRTNKPLTQFDAESIQLTLHAQQRGTERLMDAEQMAHIINHAPIYTDRNHPGKIVQFGKVGGDVAGYFRVIRSKPEDPTIVTVIRLTDGESDIPAGVQYSAPLFSK